jgi:plastocyanin
MQRRLLSLIVIAVLAIGLAACGSSSKKSDNGGGGGAAQITIKDFSFTVTGSVTAGSTVTIKNDGASTHTVTADKGEFNTGNIASGSTMTFTAPSKAGDYAFHCNIHPTMKATLKVT